MRPFLFALAICALPCLAESAKPALSATEIMARVAANQDRSELERTRYLYVQHARVLSRKGKRVMCEETTDSRIIPTADGSKSELLTISGKQWKKDHYVTYDSLPKTHDAAETKDDKDEIWDDDMDRDLVGNMRSNLTKDKSKDGLEARLFPLTSKNQQAYQYQLIGREQKNGREVYHVRFQPKNKDAAAWKDEDWTAWKGDAWIDTTDFQPVVISTAMAKKLPFVARTLLGTNVPGLGFTVVYAPQPDGVWFPVSLGSEFGLRVLFLIHRTIVINAQNRDFEKTHVTSHIVEQASTSPQ